MNETIIWRGESQNLVEAEYVLFDRTFRVKFKDGTETTYEPVDQGTALHFLSADHKESFYEHNIKGFFKPVMSEAEYARGQEAIRLLAQFREHQLERSTAWSREVSVITTEAFDSLWIPAVNAVLDRK